MLIDNSLAERMAIQHRQFFAGLAPVVRSLGIGTGEPLLDLGASMAFFAGNGSPLTLASGTFEIEHLEAITDFFRGRAVSWEAVLTPFGGPEALQRVLDRGGKAEGWESVFFRPMSEPLPDWQWPDEIRIEEVGADMLEVWSEISTKGFFGDERTEVGQALGKVMEKAENLRRYLAFWKGEPAGASVLTLGCGTAFLGGMATLPEYRGRGIQMAQLRRRLIDAKAEADLATMGASPGSSSHRNAERIGFRLAFNQLSVRVPVQ